MVVQARDSWHVMVGPMGFEPTKFVGSMKVLLRLNYFFNPTDDIRLAA